MRKLLTIIAASVFLFPFFFNYAKADSASGTNFSVTKTAAPSTVGPSSNVSFTISIKNISTANNAPIEVKDTLPNGFVYNNDAKLTDLTGAQRAFNPTVSGQIVTWIFDGTSLISIPSNQNIVISFTAKSPATIGAYVNEACLVRPEPVCAKANVTVQTSPNTGLLQNTLVISSIGGIGLASAVYLKKDRRSFEERLMSK